MASTSIIVHHNEPNKAKPELDGSISGSRMPVVVLPDRPQNISQFQRLCLNARCVNLRGSHRINVQVHVLALPCSAEGIEEEVFTQMHVSYDTERRGARRTLYSVDDILPDQLIMCRTSVEGSDRVALFHDSSTVYIGWHQGGMLYVYGSLRQNCFLPLQPRRLASPVLKTGSTLNVYLPLITAHQLALDDDVTCVPAPDVPCNRGKEQLDLQTLCVTLRILAFGAWRSRTSCLLLSVRSCATLTPLKLNAYKGDDALDLGIV